MNDIRQRWLDAIGTPSYDIPKEPIKLLARYEYPDFDAELYLQKNGPDTTQRILMAFPKEIKEPCPAVAVPFYIAEQMLGMDPATGEPIPRYAHDCIMRHLVQRGYVTASADSYHITYMESEKPFDDFSRWKDAGEKLRCDHPNWSGVGKLISDTQLLLDALCADKRVDPSRVGIAGHSLGGKMAFYTGCLDSRVKAIRASDFGIGWDQTNWRDVWYWGSQVEALLAKGMDHSELLSVAAPKPFCLIAGQYDNWESWRMMLRTPGYIPQDPRLKLINHATGHQPPAEALEEGYCFLDRWLKSDTYETL